MDILKTIRKIEQLPKDLSAQMADYFTLSDRKLEDIRQFLLENYEGKKDPWGLDINKACLYLKILYPIYKYYFRIRTFKHEDLEDSPYIFVSNHSGQIAFDGMLLSMAGIIEFAPPRLLRGMVERWMVTLPFVAKFAATAGSILGDRQNCEYLLGQKESIMVFPEGVRGIAKNTKDFYKMTSFTKGFFRMAIKTKTPLVPVAIIGAEEAYPFVYHIKPLAKLLGLPALPITPLFPWLGPLGALPLPSPIDIHFGKPFHIPSDMDVHIPDDELQPYVDDFKKQIEALLVEGLEKRRPFFERIGLKDKRKL